LEKERLMSSRIESGQVHAHDPASRGYHVVYREHEVNHCPGCSRTHWYVGRTMAECAFCSTALPLEASKQVGQGGVTIQVRRPAFPFEQQAFAA
jgi:hypothetical protein